MSPVDSSPREPSSQADPAPTGTLSFSGAAGVTLSGVAGVTSPGAIPPGMYAAAVRFDSGTEVQIANVRVEAGKATRVTCVAQFATCKVGPPT